MESRIPRVNTHFRLPPIMLTNSPSTSRTTSSTVSDGSRERKRPANWQACRRSHSSRIAPFQSPAMWTAAVRRSPLGNQGVPHSPTSRLSMVANTDSTICASSLGSISALDSVNPSVFSAGDIDDSSSHGLSFKPLLDAERRLRAAQQQPTASKQSAVEFLQYVLLGFRVDTDHDVAAEPQVERPEGTHALAQVNRLETGHPAHQLAQLPLDSGTAEVLDQEGRRQTPVHLNLLVLAGPGALQNLRGKVGAQNLDVPVTETFLQEKQRQAESFLPSRCRGRPEPQLLQIPTVILQAGQQDSSDGLIMGGIAKEVGFVGRHGLDDLAADLCFARGLEERAQVVDRAEAELPDQRREAAFEQVVLVLFQYDARLGIDMLLEEPVVFRVNLRDGSLVLHTVPLNFGPPSAGFPARLDRGAARGRQVPHSPQRRASPKRHSKPRPVLGRWPLVP